MEAWAEGFECSFEALYRILLFGMIEALIVHAGDGKDHSDITALG